MKEYGVVGAAWPPVMAKVRLSTTIGLLGSLLAGIALALLVHSLDSSIDHDALGADAQAAERLAVTAKPGVQLEHGPRAHGHDGRVGVRAVIEPSPAGDPEGAACESRVAGARAGAFEREDAVPGFDQRRRAR